MNKYEDPDEEIMWEDNFNPLIGDWSDLCEEDDNSLQEQDETTRSEVLATVLTDSIQDTFGADEEDNSCFDYFVPPAVQRADQPACAEALLQYEGRPMCIHICDLPDGSCRLSMAFFGRHPKQQKLQKLINRWPKDPIADFLQIDKEDCTTYALVLSGILKPTWCDMGPLLQLALENIFGYFTDPETNGLVLDMLNCYDPI